MSKRVGSDASNNEDRRGPYSLGLWIHTLYQPHRQRLLREAMKIPPLVMERLILELRITVSSPYYSIILFILCRVAACGCRREGVTNNEDSCNHLLLMYQASWCEFNICGGIISERGWRWLMNPTPLCGTIITKVNLRLSELIGEDAIRFQ